MLLIVWYVTLIGAAPARNSSATDGHTLTTMSTSDYSTVATYDETRAEALRLTGRNYGIIRHVFVQQPRGSAVRPSTLGTLVNKRKHRALVLYLLLLTIWPMLEKRQEPFEGALWARLLSTKEGPAWTTSDISKTWSDLETLGLIERTREGRAVRITPRREDGKAQWTAPGQVGRDRRETYFSVPGVFWTSGLFAELTLPGLAVLLIVAAETSKSDEVWLSYERASEWYGLSAASFKNGTRELEAHGLLVRRPETVKAPLSPTGSTTKWWYSLTGAYSSAARAAAQETARKEREARTKKQGVTKKRTKSPASEARGRTGTSSPPRKRGAAK